MDKKVGAPLYFIQCQWSPGKKLPLSSFRKDNLAAVFLRHTTTTTTSLIVVINLSKVSDMFWNLFWKVSLAEMSQARWGKGKKWTLQGSRSICASCDSLDPSVPHATHSLCLGRMLLLVVICPKWFHRACVNLPEVQKILLTSVPACRSFCVACVPKVSNRIGKESCCCSEFPACRLGELLPILSKGFRNFGTIGSRMRSATCSCFQCI